MTTGLSLFLDRFPQDVKPHLTLQENGLMDLASSHPSVIKVMNNTNYLKWLADNFPDIIRIGRDFAREEEFQATHKLGRESSDTMASDWFKLFKPAIKAAGSGTFWEVAWNEPSKDHDQLVLLTDFYLSIMKLGIPVVIFNFSAEFRPWDVESTIKPALDKAQELGYMLGLHAYQSPRLTDNMNSDFLFPNKNLKSKVKKVITELGIDRIISEGKQYPGWRTTGCSAEDYAQQLIAVDKEYRKDKSVVGECVYISTRNDGDDQKMPFATSFRVPGRGKQPPEPCVDDYIIAYNMANLNVPMWDTTPPVVVPPVDPPPVPPTEAGVYVVKSPYNLRWEPSTAQGATTVIKTLPTGTEVNVKKIENGWGEVDTFISAEGLRKK